MSQNGSASLVPPVLAGPAAAAWLSNVQQLLNDLANAKVSLPVQPSSTAAPQQQQQQPSSEPVDIAALAARARELAAFTQAFRVTADGKIEPAQAQPTAEQAQAGRSQLAAAVPAAESSSEQTAQRWGDNKAPTVQTAAQNPPAPLVPTSAPLHLAFMSSSPLTARDPITGHIMPVETLAHGQEQRLLLDSLGECGKAVRLRFYPATVDRLRMLLSNGCAVLHFSGHGILASANSNSPTASGPALPSEQQAAAPQALPSSATSDSLVLETADGAAQLLDVMTLSRLLQAGGSTLRLVVVASCHSLHVGETFARAGVPFVVCVRREDRVLDRASLTFTKSFYHALFTSHPVPACFAIAQARVAAEASMASESEKFVLLTPQSRLSLPLLPGTPEAADAKQPANRMPSADAQRLMDAPLFSGLPEGKFIDMTTTPLFNQLPARGERLIGRNVDVQTILSALLKQRLITVRGPPGIGKSTVVRLVSHYALDRALFNQGVLYVSVRGLDTTDAVLLSILRAIRRHLSEDTARAIEQAAAAHSVSPTDSKGGAAALDESRDHLRLLLAHLRGKEVLVVLDNCEDPLHSGGEAFRSMLSQLLDEAGGVSMLLGSREAVGGGLGAVAEKVYSLAPLAPLDAARLFDAYAPRPINVNELGVQAAPASGALSGKGALGHLAAHPVLRFLGGHPQAISLAAPLLADRTLPELQQLLSTKSLDALSVATANGAGAIVPDEKSAVSTLMASLDASVEHLRRHNPRAAGLFAFFALMPAGAHAADFDAIWGDSWRDLAYMLTRASLIVRAPRKLYDKVLDRYSTFPFVTRYAERLLLRGDVLPAASSATLIQRCRLRCARLCDAIFERMGTSLAGSDLSYELLDTHELNMWAALRRWAPTDNATANAQVYASAQASHSGLLYKPSAGEGADAGNAEGPEDVLEAAPDDRERKALLAPSVSSKSVQPENGAALPYVRAGGVASKVVRASPIGRLASAFSAVLFLAGRRDAAVRAAERGVAACHELSDVLGEANCRKLLAVVWASAGGGDAARAKNLQSAKRQLGTALILYRSAGSLLGQGVTLAFLGNLHMKLQNLHGAKTCIERATTCFERLAHKPALINCYRWLAILSKRLPGSQQTEKATEYFKKAKRLSEQKTAAEVKSINSGISAVAALAAGVTPNSSLSEQARREQRNAAFTQRWLGADMSLHIIYVLSNSGDGLTDQQQPDDLDQQSALGSLLDGALDSLESKSLRHPAAPVQQVNVSASTLPVDDMAKPRPKTKSKKSSKHASRPPIQRRPSTAGPRVGTAQANAPSTASSRIDRRDRSPSPAVPSSPPPEPEESKEKASAAKKSPAVKKTASPPTKKAAAPMAQKSKSSSGASSKSSSGTSGRASASSRMSARAAALQRMTRTADDEPLGEEPKKSGAAAAAAGGSNDSHDSSFVSPPTRQTQPRTSGTLSSTKPSGLPKPRARSQSPSKPPTGESKSKSSPEDEPAVPLTRPSTASSKLRRPRELTPADRAGSKSTTTPPRKAAVVSKAKTKLAWRNNADSTTVSTAKSSAQDPLSPRASVAAVNSASTPERPKPQQDSSASSAPLAALSITDASTPERKSNETTPVTAPQEPQATSVDRLIVHPLELDSSDSSVEVKMKSPMSVSAPLKLDVPVDPNVHSGVDSSDSSDIVQQRSPLSLSAPIDGSVTVGSQQQNGDSDADIDDNDSGIASGVEADVTITDLEELEAQLEQEQQRSAAAQQHRESIALHRQRMSPVHVADVQSAMAHPSLLANALAPIDPAEEEVDSENDAVRRLSNSQPRNSLISSMSDASDGLDSPTVIDKRRESSGSGENMPLRSSSAIPTSAKNLKQALEAVITVSSS